ncbi:MAG: hypothetical protein CENE_01295 [Candidatus Celerinatantimonas neptuna]|nr:MAG: hypothetical protein CENE_01295 [Candidatus Celerinatantimonas neptuna]
MFGYIALAILLVGVVPTLCYFAGFIHLYLQFGGPVAGCTLLLWLLQDTLKMRRKKVRVVKKRRR